MSDTIKGVGGGEGADQMLLVQTKLTGISLVLFSSFSRISSITTRKETGGGGGGGGDRHKSRISTVSNSLHSGKYNVKNTKATETLQHRSLGKTRINNKV